jgi:hypothetical protein
MIHAVYLWLAGVLHALGLGARPYSSSGVIPRTLEFLGIDSVNGRWYAFWSGFGSDISEFGLFGLLWITWKRHNCHKPWCLRIARHTIDRDGHQTVWCHKHIKRQS